MGSYTKIGLLLLILGGILGIISNIAFSLAGNIAITLSVLGGIGGLCSFIGIILLILGRKEFGEKHRKFVVYALILFILSIIIPSIIIAAVTFSYVSQGITGGVDVNFMQNIFFIIPFAAILGGLAYVLLLYNLENGIGRRILFAAFAVTIITSIIISLNIGSAFEETIGSIDFETASQQDISEVTTEFSQKISISGIYGVANGVLMLIALIIPYKRITSGELIPISTSTKPAESDRICPNCGKAIPFDANICPYCSKKFETYL